MMKVFYSCTSILALCGLSACLPVHPFYSYLLLTASMSLCVRACVCVSPPSPKLSLYAYLPLCCCCILSNKKYKEEKYVGSGACGVVQCAPV